MGLAGGVWVSWVVRGNINLILTMIRLPKHGDLFNINCSRSNPVRRRHTTAIPFDTFVPNIYVRMQRFYGFPWDCDPRH